MKSAQPVKVCSRDIPTYVCFSHVHTDYLQGCLKGTRNCVYPPANEQSKKKLTARTKTGLGHDRRSPDSEHVHEISSSPPDTATTAPGKQTAQWPPCNHMHDSCWRVDLARDSASDATSPPSTNASPNILPPNTHPFSKLSPHMSRKQTTNTSPGCSMLTKPRNSAVGFSKSSRIPVSVG